MGIQQIGDRGANESGLVDGVGRMIRAPGKTSFRTLQQEEGSSSRRDPYAHHPRRPPMWPERHSMANVVLLLLLLYGPTPMSANTWDEGRGRRRKEGGHRRSIHRLGFGLPPAGPFIITASGHSLDGRCKLNGWPSSGGRRRTKGSPGRAQNSIWPFLLRGEKRVLTVNQRHRLGHHKLGQGHHHHTIHPWGGLDFTNRF